MKKPLIVMMALLAAQAQAQTKGPLRTVQPQQPTKDAREAASRLNAARKDGVAEEGRLNEARAGDSAMAEQARQAATNLLRTPDPAQAATAKRGDESLAAALKNVTEEGKARLSKGAAHGPTKAPQRTAPLNPEAAPKPAPLNPAPIDNPAIPGSRVVITCTGAAFFDSEKSIALFTDNVEVHHPQFFVSCDEFEVHMLKEEKAPAGTPAKPGDAIKNPISDPIKPPPVPGASAEAAPAPDSSIKIAIARGRMVTIEKLTETGEVQVGHSKHATYDGPTGDILLRDFPQVQRGKNLQIATDPSTTMLLKQNGALITKGPNRTEIIQDDKPAGGNRIGNPPAPPPSPNPNTSPRQPRQ